MGRFLLVFIGIYSALGIECNSTCTASFLEEDLVLCELGDPCYSSNCNWHNFKCLDHTCYKYNFANGICDESCNFEVLNYDSLDCKGSNIAELYVTADSNSLIPDEYSKQIYKTLSLALTAKERYLRVYLSAGYHLFSDFFSFPSISKIIRLSPWMCESMSSGYCFEKALSFTEEKPEIRMESGMSINTGAWSELILENLLIDGSSLSLDKISTVSGRSMFEIGKYARLTLNNVTIRDIVLPYRSIIQFESSSYVGLMHAEFINIHLTTNHTNSAIISSKSTTYSSEGEFIYLHGQILNSNNENSIQEDVHKIPLILISNFKRLTIANILLDSNISTSSLIDISSLSNGIFFNNTYLLNKSPYIISSVSSNLHIYRSNSTSNTSQDLNIQKSTLNLSPIDSSDLYSDLISPYQLVYITSNNDYVISSNPIPDEIPTYKPVNLNFAILDRRLKRMDLDNSSICDMKIYSYTQNKTVNYIRTIASNGYYNFSVTLAAQPSDKLMIILESKLVNTRNQIQLNYYANLTLKNCSMGEEIRSNGCIPCGVSFYNTKPGENCVKCDKNAICKGGEELPRCIEGFYSLESDYTCRKCEDNTICPGGNVTYPKSGYWRDSMHSEIYECLVPSACLSGSETKSTKGVCRSGHRAKLCHSCEDHYQRTNTNECEECQDDYKVILLIVLWIFILSLYLFTIIRSSIRAAYSSDPTQSISLKIFTNYMQIITIISYFNFEWPQRTLDLFTIQRAMVDTTDRVYKIECLTGNTLNPFFIKVILVVIQPFILILVTTVIWILRNIRSKVEYLKEKIIGSITVLLLWIHPFVLKFTLSAFSCKEIEGNSWLYADLDIECWKGDHMLYAMIFGLTGLIIWGISVPAICVFLLKRNRDKLADIQTKLKYGFLYNGFNHKNYYWEVLIVYRKVILVTCAVFLKWEDQAMTVVIVHIIVFVYLTMESKVRPYVEPNLNRLDICSLLVILVTVYSAILQSTIDLDDSSENVLLIVVILLNSLFMLYWTLISSHRIMAIFYKKYEWFRKFTRKLPRHLTQSFKFFASQSTFVNSPQTENDIIRNEEDLLRQDGQQEQNESSKQNIETTPRQIDSNNHVIGREGSLILIADDFDENLIFNAPFNSIVNLSPIYDGESDSAEQ